MGNTKLNVELIREKINMIQSCYEEISSHVEEFATDDEYTDFYHDVEMETEIENLRVFLRSLA